jgi:hypothetical protein
VRGASGDGTHSPVFCTGLLISPIASGFSRGPNVQVEVSSGILDTTIAELQRMNAEVVVVILTGINSAVISRGQRAEKCQDGS